METYLKDKLFYIYIIYINKFLSTLKMLSYYQVINLKTKTLHLYCYLLLYFKKFESNIFLAN